MPSRPIYWIFNGDKWSGVDIDAQYKLKRKRKDSGNRLRSVRLKIKRAGDHVQEIEKMLRNFTDSHRIVREMDPDGTKEHMKIIIGQIPEMLPLAIGETLSQLRSALDHLIRSIDGVPERTDFPIDTEKKSPTLKGKIKKLPLAVRSVVRRLKPYRRGNEPLWAMNRLRNRDIHHDLILVVPRRLAWNAGGRVNLRDTNCPLRISLPAAQTFENEIHVLTVFDGAKIEPDAKPEITIAFNERGIKMLKNQSVLTALHQFVALTEGIVDIFEKRFFPKS